MDETLRNKLQTWVGIMGQALRTDVVGCWALEADRHLRLRAQIGIDQEALDLVAATWKAHGDTLRAGHPLRVALGTFWPLLDGGELFGVIFTAATRSNEDAELAMQRIGRWLALAAGSNAPEEDPELRELRQAMRACGGNVAAVARVLRVALRPLEPGSGDVQAVAGWK